MGSFRNLDSDPILRSPLLMVSIMLFCNSPVEICRDKSQLIYQFYQ